MNDVPETGSMLVSPITRTAIAPRRKVVERRTIPKTAADPALNPPRRNTAVTPKSRDDHEDGNVLHRPFVPALAFDEFRGLLAGERGADVPEDVGEGPPHLQKTEDATSDDRTNRHGADRASEGAHLEREIRALHGEEEARTGTSMSSDAS